MDLKQVESQRSELLMLAMLLVMVFLCGIAYLTIRQQQGALVPALTILSLLACLYVIDKERRLKSLQRQLIDELVEEQKKTTSLESRLHEIAGLYRAISTVNSVVEPEYTFDAVLRAALDLAESDLGSLMLLDELDDCLKIVSAQGLSDAVVAQTRQKVGTGVAGWVAKHCEPVLLTEDGSDDERFEGQREVDEDLHISISVPLDLRGEVLGVLNVGHTAAAAKSEFSEYELRMLTLFAKHASVAIESAQLRLAKSVAS